MYVFGPRNSSIEGLKKNSRIACATHSISSKRDTNINLTLANYYFTDFYFLHFFRLFVYYRLCKRHQLMFYQC